MSGEQTACYDIEAAGSRKRGSQQLRDEPGKPDARNGRGALESQVKETGCTIRAEDRAGRREGNRMELGLTHGRAQKQVAIRCIPEETATEWKRQMRSADDRMPREINAEDRIAEGRGCRTRAAHESEKSVGRDPALRAKHDVDRIVGRRGRPCGIRARVRRADSKRREVGNRRRSRVERLEGAVRQTPFGSHHWRSTPVGAGER